jgi:hypothetical protein
MKEKIAFLGLALLSLMTASCSCKSVPDSSSLPIEGSSLTQIFKNWFHYGALPPNHRHFTYPA